MAMLYQDLLIKLLLAGIFSAIIGYEREISKKSAGLRTHILVCVGTMFATAIAVQYFPNPDSIGRVIAGLITGIGFIGAGAIMHSREDISGLTSAAGIWATAMIGIGIGLGYYMYSLIVTVAVYGVFELGHFERVIAEYTSYHHKIQNKKTRKKSIKRKKT